MTDDDKAVVLDLRGLICPLPVLKTQKALSRLKAGDRLSIETTDPLTDIDIPHFCREKGHKLVDKSARDEIRIFVIEKGG
ncbi:MAG: sulfurtransferase TusA family protein [Phycisphaerales bacterium]|nr:sulfurtransferase TusA family protein [Phycisphaerales bacterium]